LRDQRNELRRGIAASIALVELMPGEAGQTTFNIGYGFYRSEHAVGATIVHRLKAWDHVQFNVGAAYGFDGKAIPAMRGGVSFMF
jgi:hypothetical protein